VHSEGWEKCQHLENDPGDPILNEVFLELPGPAVPSESAGIGCSQSRLDLEDNLHPQEYLQGYLFGTLKTVQVL
jgi:hypothetical protein